MLRREKLLDIGSDLEIARRVVDDLGVSFGRIVHAEGAFWRYGGSHWEQFNGHELRRVVHGYDGAEFITPAGNFSAVKLSSSRINSIINECSALCADPAFFEQQAVGINCASGLIRFNANERASIRPHHPDHRHRHTLPGHWHLGAQVDPPVSSLLFKLLDGVFKGDADAGAKVTLLAEICGSAALGYATNLIQPRAVILVGETAENGKSQILDLARGLLPASAICSMPESHGR